MIGLDLCLVLGYRHLNTFKVCISYIRIYHDCEGRIEKSVSRIAVWHHEACQVMTNGDH